MLAYKEPGIARASYRVKDGLGITSRGHPGVEPVPKEDRTFQIFLELSHKKVLQIVVKRIEQSIQHGRFVPQGLIVAIFSDFADALGAPNHQVDDPRNRFARELNGIVGLALIAQLQGMHKTFQVILEFIQNRVRGAISAEAVNLGQFVGLYL